MKLRGERSTNQWLGNTIVVTYRVCFMNLVIPNGGFCLVDIWRVIKLVQGRSSVILSDILKVCSISFFDFVV